VKTFHDIFGRATWAARYPELDITTIAKVIQIYTSKVATPEEMSEEMSSMIEMTLEKLMLLSITEKITESHITESISLATGGRTFDLLDRVLE
jgi:hypothetical protein